MQCKTRCTRYLVLELILNIGYPLVSDAGHSMSQHSPVSAGRFFSSPMICASFFSHVSFRPSESLRGILSFLSSMTPRALGVAVRKAFSLPSISCPIHWTRERLFWAKSRSGLLSPVFTPGARSAAMLLLAQEIVIMTRVTL